VIGAQENSIADAGRWVLYALKVGSLGHHAMSILHTVAEESIKLMAKCQARSSVMSASVYTAISGSFASGGDAPVEVRGALL